jgi:hypothetical protein
MFGITTHERLMERTRINFAIFMDGQYPIYNATLRLDSQPIVSGQKISLGAHNFSVSHPKGEPFCDEFLRVAWPAGFRTNQFETHQRLAKRAGNPAATTITITGPEYSTTLYNNTGTNVSVPVRQW